MFWKFGRSLCHSPQVLVNRSSGTIWRIDIYSRLDGSLAGLLAFRLKSCDSVGCRLTAGRERRLPASATRGQQQRLATAGFLQRSRAADHG
jgi:hypothetical protein